MPSSLTHYWFARDVVNQNRDVLDFLRNDEYKYLTYIGTQGPDVFFFYGMVPWKKRKDAKKIQAIGHDLHQDGEGDKFIKMIDYIKKDSSKDKSVLYAYLFGALLHYTLDRIIHPFVFYRTGFQLEGQIEYHYFSDHAIYEAFIDTNLLAMYNTSPYKLPTYKTLKANKEYVKRISKMYANKEEFKEDTFYESYLDMLTAEKVLLDRFHIKRALVRLLGKRHTSVYALIHKNKQSKHDKVDYLNAHHEPWANPCSNVASSESFIDLYEKAFKDSETIVKIMLDLMKGNDVNDQIRNFCNHLNYDGVIKGEEMKYFKSVYQREE